MKIDIKDVSAGLLFSAFGSFFLINAWTNFDLGTPTRVGPAVFPMILGGVLLALGVAITAQSLGRTSTAFGRVPWRGIFFTMLAILSFGLFVEVLGFVPAIALSILLSACASARMTLKIALMLTVGLTLFCVLVFKVGLRLPLEPLGSLFR